MELVNKVAVITGGSGGIGAAMAKAFLAEGARGVMLADLDAEAVTAIATDIGCEGMVCDVTNEAQIKRLVAAAESKYGQIDLFCSNAAKGHDGVLTDVEDDDWNTQWNLHVMAHMYAARAVLPGMIKRGEGYLLNTASAAGLLAALSACLLYTSDAADE